jgi:xanthine dehydrogenase accessory factor
LFRDLAVVVRGGGELASAAARLLSVCGFPVVVLETPAPLAVRRRVSFAEAVFSGSVTVEGVVARRCAPDDVGGDFVPVLIDPGGDFLTRRAPAVLVDGRMAKRNLGTRREQAGVVVALGPGFSAGEDVHAVVETQRGAKLGRVLWSGSASADTAVPAPVLGVTDARVLRAPRGGRFRSASRIGDILEAGARVGDVEGAAVEAPIGGLVRGLLADGVAIEAGVKIGDIDPRGVTVDPARLSDKARAVAAGVLEAVLISFRERA